MTTVVLRERSTAGVTVSGVREGFPEKVASDL